MGRKLTTEEFIERASKVHGDRYDYSKVEYNRWDIKVCIICPEHGEFWQTPNSHLFGKGCQKCAAIKRAESFVRYNLNKRNWDFEQPEEYKLIPLTNGKFTMVDNEDFEKVKDINWVYSNGYAYNSTIGLMHRFIMNCPDDKVVDHIDHDTFDNRKSNLRICTRQQNSMNQKVQKRYKTSKYKGVFWDKYHNKWQSIIKKDGKRFHIGRYNNEEEAAMAYNRRAVEMFGDFSKLNVL